MAAKPERVTMPSKRADPRLIKLHRTYSVEEISDRLGIHKNTVRGWQARGLNPVDDKRPVVFQGSKLRAFLEEQRRLAKRPCPTGSFYCFRCRVPRSPALGMVEYTPRNARRGNLKALCQHCNGLMHRAASLDSLPVIFPGIEVTIIGGTGAHNLAAPTLPKL